MASRGRIAILFGSQTGCAEEVAHRLAAEAVRRRYQPMCCSMETYELRTLPSEKFVVLVASTTGEGEVPDGMRAFWQFLLRKDLPSGSLGNVRHACFGLGDSSYPKFCYAAKRLHRRMEQLGSKAIAPIGLGDDQDGLGIEHALGPWLASLWSVLDACLPLPAGCEVRPESECPPARYGIELLQPACDEASWTAQASQPVAIASIPVPLPVPPPPAMLPASSAASSAASPASCAVSASRHAPFSARVLENTRLTAVGCGRDVRHIALDVSGSGLDYQPGDALAVQPHNPLGGTKALLAALLVGIDPATRLRLVSAAPHAPPLRWSECSVLELFVEHLDVYGSPRRSFFRLLAHFATDPLHQEKLAELGSAEGAAELLDYVTRPRRTYAEVLLEFPSARPPVGYYLDLIPPLRERYFSIASSPRLFPSQVHLTVAVVRYQTLLSLPRFGVCSTYLAALQATEPDGGAPADTVAVWLRRGCLRLPAMPDAPLVMIGPGTGVAPFRAFTQTRQAQRAELALATPPTGAGAVVGDALLYFGCRRPEHDFLYRGEWAEHLEAGHLQGVHAAFSRVPDAPKVYVQHKMVEPGSAPQLWALLAHPACHVYIAGSSGAMPRDVRKAMRLVAMAQGGLDEAAATAWLTSLEAGKRLQCETW